jgi:O-antigen/teichoic acid export membrane protein
VVAALAPFAAVFYADWRLYPMVVVSASKLILVGAALVPLQLLTRELHFKAAGAVQTLATLGEAVTKVVLVLAGFGAWGLVLANVARGGFLCLALWRFSDFRPALVAADASTRKAVHFGFRSASASILYHAYRNLDNLLIGRVLGTRVLGIYQTAFQLGMTPLEIVLQLVNRVQYPIYARLRDHPAELLQAFNRSARSLLLLLGPVAALLCFASTDLLALIGGGRWLPAVPMIQVLAWASLLRGISQLFPQLYNATGRPGFSVVDALLTGGTLVAGFVLALALAPEGRGAHWVAWVWLLSYPLPLMAHFWMAARCSPVRAVPMLAELARPALGIGLVALVLALGSQLRPWLASPLLTFAVLVLLALGTHALFLRLALGMRLGDVLPKKQ